MPAAIAATVIVPFILWKVVRILLARRGDTSPATRDFALRYFTQDDILRGKQCTTPYYLPSVVGYAIELAFLWAMVFLGLATRLQHLVEPVSGSLFLQTGLFLLIFNLAGGILLAPLTFYTDYVLGRRLGKLKQTFPQWLLFNLKGVVLSFAISWPVFWFFLAIVRHYPQSWWFIVAAGLTLFMLAITFIQPILLAPIFYKFTRLDDGPLRDRLLDICRRARIAVRDVFIQHESKVTTQTNAYFTGIGHSKRIVLYDNLLNTNTPEEAAVVVAHEAGHWAGRHILIGIGLSVAGVFSGCYGLFRLFQIDAVRQFFGTSVGEPAILPVLALLGMIVSTFLDPAIAAISRALERRADRASLDLTADPDAFIGAHVKLVRSNKTDILPHPLLMRLYASHPTALERIRSAETAKQTKDSQV